MFFRADPSLNQPIYVSTYLCQHAFPHSWLNQCIQYLFLRFKPLIYKFVLQLCWRLCLVKRIIDTPLSLSLSHSPSLTLSLSLSLSLPLSLLSSLSLPIHLYLSTCLSLSLYLSLCLLPYPSLSLYMSVSPTQKLRHPCVLVSGRTPFNPIISRQFIQKFI